MPGVLGWEKRKNNRWMSSSQAGLAGQTNFYEVLFRWVYHGKIQRTTRLRIMARMQIGIAGGRGACA